MIRASALLFVMFALVIAGCDDDGSGSDEPPATATPTEAASTVEEQPSSAAAATVTATRPADVVRTAECRAAANKVMPGDANGTLQHDGLERTYITHIPPAYDGVTRRLPLVLNFHGFGSNARDQALYSGLPAKGDAEGFIVVSPNGTGERQAWNLAFTGGIDDIGFVGALLDKLESELCIASTRVYAAGMSNGAAFAQRVACAMPVRCPIASPASRP